jgi:hypothetical protein
MEISLEKTPIIVVGIGSTPTPWRANRGNAAVCCTARRTREAIKVAIMDVLADRVGHGDNSNDKKSTLVWFSELILISRTDWTSSLLLINMNQHGKVLGSTIC